MPKTVLIVDDSEFMRKLLRNIIEQDDYKIVGEAEDGSKALKLYKQLKPDIITMDIILPNKTGIEIVKEINKVDKNNHTKIVMVSALGQQQLVLEALQSGAKEYITKPFEKDRILEVLKRLE